MKWQPEIVAVRFLSFEEAMQGTNDGAKSYNSREWVSEQAFRESFERIE